MLVNECSFSLPTIGVVSKYEERTIPGYTNRKNIDRLSGKRGMVRAGGSASRTIEDQSSTDPGGGFRRTKQRNPQWRMLAGRNKGRQWAADNQEFPALGRPPSTVGNTKESNCSACPSTANMDRLPKGSPTPVFRKSDKEMWPAQEIRSTPHKDIIERTRGVTTTIATPLSALAENFTPRKTSRKPSTSRVPTDSELDRSLYRKPS